MATNEQFFRITESLAEVTRSDGERHSTLTVRGNRFAYYWPRTQTVGLKQLISEQKALVAERPHVFEEQFTWGGFGWVVVLLDGVEEDELTELVFEAWRLSAPEDLLHTVPDPGQE
ncbi:MmcQ/YjbR family DNA-binding protein [Actinokineospora bangkokensis]|uniref:YjbR protein n=1 Tax=Actinokineospora bangkokensis TaxID=1193682 RepID=A0A1Q9LPT3_9PSEU|nr:MmcQ/YjbR family DNA-binding protein [Actinokineospora bangkokensis]OLR94035.1 hypothetical protein BJP25_13750 [Actinokineospora bangkokensis]